MIPQLRRSPGFGGVTRLALRAEQTGVNLRIGMARHARLRRAFEFVIDMTLHTFRRDMLAVQHKRCLAVIEVLHVARTIMAALAIAPIFLNVLRHERRVLFAVTIHARLLREFKISAGVASLARKRRPVKIPLM